jgi:segregation and condensation protein B
VQSPAALASAVESLLFAADEPVSLRQLAEILSVSTSEVEKALADLERACQGRGVRLAKVSGGFQLLTRPEFAPFVHKLRQPRADRLSRAALEVLAIIAYRQPITRPEIDHVRGVNSSGSLDALLSHRLIKEAGRKSTPGRPFLYRSTEHFLRAFGLASLSDLPPLPPDLPGGAPPPLSPLPLQNQAEPAQDGGPVASPGDGCH